MNVIVWGTAYIILLVIVLVSIFVRSFEATVIAILTLNFICLPLNIPSELDKKDK